MLPMIIVEKIMPMLETISIEAIASPVAVFFLKNGLVLSFKK